MKKTLGLFFVLHCILFFFPAFAVAKNFWIAPKIGTTGIGAEIGYQITDVFGLRVNGGYLTEQYELGGIWRESYGSTYYSGDPDITLSSELFNLTALADVYFFQKNFNQMAELAFKISAGVAYNEFSIKEEVSGTFYLADTQYTGNADVDISYKNNVAPYLGLGGAFRFGGANGNSVGIIVDVGGMYIGDTDVEITTDIPDADATQLAADVQQVESDRKATSFPFYPVASVGIAFYF